ncbi:MAG: TetR/AcrR family transcriptional regulator [Pseudomonadales bacterium]
MSKIPSKQALTPRKTKGELTADRILDAAEGVFAARGYQSASLREIAQIAQIKEPGLYNYFKGKQALYSAVLDRALSPMAQAMESHLGNALSYQDYVELPIVMTDLLIEHPTMASLFQQALQGDKAAVDNLLINRWLEHLFSKGKQTIDALGINSELDTEDIAIHIIAMFNLITGYFLSQRAFATLAEGDISSPENIEKQKRLLRRVIRTMLVS